MQDQEYRELADKIGRVEISMAEKLGEVLASVRELGATMKSAVDQVREMRDDVKKANETAAKALESTDSAHKRLNTLEVNVKPLTDANVVERLRNLEATNVWLVRTVIGSIILAILGAGFAFSNIGGG